jgi:hypothetical protein
MKKTIVGIIVGIIGFVTIACGNAGTYDSDYVGLCMQRTTNVRVPDDMCSNQGTAYWDYVDVDMYSNFTYPAYYRQLPPNVVVIHTEPKNVTIVKNLGSSGGLARNLSSIKNSVSSRINRKPAAKPTKNSSIVRGGFGVPKKTTSN